MKTNDVYTAYVAWSNGGKRRPVLIRRINKDEVLVYKITTKYQNKSNEIRRHYYPIADLDEAGLKRQSYIDTLNLVGLPRSVQLRRIGQLSVKDMHNLAEFIERLK
ncbi:MazF family toxin-antitoxin system [Limosilactobacillus coleohominis DSM 14060]|nr:MazF family toxin-antitoxin system [Limosilactobacillus coleohominis DSM 14060]